MSWRTLLCLALVVLSASSGSQAHEVEGSALWERINKPEQTIPIYVLNETELIRALSADVNRGTGGPEQSERTLVFPFPNGDFATFVVNDSGVMPGDLAAQFPQIRSFSGVCLTNPQVTVRMNYCARGLRAHIFTPSEIIHIFAPPEFNGAYISTGKKDLLLNSAFQCLSELRLAEEGAFRMAALGQQRGGRHLRTYRLAVAASGEFTQHNGGTVAGAMSTIVSTVNYINGIYEKELGIRLQLVSGNNKIVYADPGSDPYSANIASAQTLLENQNAIDAEIGAGNYDIGHLFNTAEFGLAYIGVVCREDWKARGCIGTSTPGGDQFFGDFAAHEIAHQFGANHTFNSLDGHCLGSRTAVAAYEPGSGSTLMAYAGFCNNDNLQAHNNTYFHSASYDEIQQYITTGSGAGCAVVTETGNTPPSVDTAPQIVIPRGTPFKLTASGHDPDGDAITYCWEQRDLGPAQSVYDSDNGKSPLFRSFAPTPMASRTFPRMEDLITQARLRGEQLPMIPRDLHFRVTARDNRGGIGTSDTVVTVAGAGPLRVISHNTGDSQWGVQTVTWDVADTDKSPVNATHVNILLSTNGGLNFNVVLAANTPNDGSEQVLFPNEDIGSARLKIEAANGIFFAVNDSAFTIAKYFAVTDFNFDNQVDILWQNSDGRLAAWLLDGTNFLQASFLRGGVAVSPQWRLAGMNDFNSDAQADLLWQHVDGRSTVWFMNGSEFLSAQPLRNGARMAADWRIVSASDLDADGQPDLLLHRANGKMAIWKMNGTDLVQAIPLRQGKPVSAIWQPIGVSDFTSDGQNDILFRRSDGQLAAWVMNGFEFIRSELLNAPRADSKWELGSIADLDRNGQNDLVWVRDDGRIRIWFMAGNTAFKYGTLRNGFVGVQWHLVGPK